MAGDCSVDVFCKVRINRRGRVFGKESDTLGDWPTWRLCRDHQSDGLRMILDDYLHAFADPREKLGEIAVRFGFRYVNHPFPHGLIIHRARSLQICSLIRQVWPAAVAQSKEKEGAGTGGTGGVD